MNIFRSILARKKNVAVSPVDSLWPEIHSAIGSAGIYVRREDDQPTMVEMPGYGGFKYENAEIKLFFTRKFVGITAEDMARATRFLHSRVVMAMRNADEKSALFDPPKRRWSASSW